VTEFNRIVENHAVGNEIIVFNTLFLIFRGVIGNFAFPAEQEPLAKGIKLFHFIRGGLNHLAELLIREKLEQEDGAYHTAQLSKCLINSLYANYKKECTLPLDLSEQRSVSRHLRRSQRHDQPAIRSRFAFAQK